MDLPPISDPPRGIVRGLLGVHARLSGTRRAHACWLSVPWALTLARIGLGLAAAASVAEFSASAILACVVLLALLDAADGASARALAVQTRAGAVADGLADLQNFLLLPVLWIVAAGALGAGSPPAAAAARGACSSSLAAALPALFASFALLSYVLSGAARLVVSVRLEWNGAASALSRGLPTPFAAIALLMVATASGASRPGPPAHLLWALAPTTLAAAALAVAMWIGPRWRRPDVILSRTRRSAQDAPT